MSHAAECDVVVVGAGIGGLTAAAYLQALGKDVVVVDQHSVVGGNVSVFTHHGYEFDVGTHYVGGAGEDGLFHRVYGGLGLDADVEWRPLDRDGFDHYVFADGSTYAVPNGAGAYRERLLAAFPDERDSLSDYCDFVEDVSGAFMSTMGAGPSDKLAVLFANRDTTLGDLCERLGLSPRARTVIAGQHLVYGVGPARMSAVMHALVVSHYMDGAFYPAGGSTTLSETLAEYVRARGGRIHLRTRAERVLVEDGRVAGVALHSPTPVRESGVPAEIRVPVVVSNADLKRTVLDLVGAAHFPADFTERVRALRMAPPLFVVYLVLDRDLGAEGFPNANFHVLPDDVDSEYDALARGEVSGDPTVFLSFASVKDPGNDRLCRPGQTNLQAMALVPGDHAYWGLAAGPVGGERYRRNPVYRERRDELTERVLTLAERAVPGLRDSIAYIEAATPVTHERFVRSTNGTSYGFEMTPDQSLDRRPGPATPLPGLFLTGQGIMTGHGIAACMTGGVLTAGTVLGEPLLQRVLGGERVVTPAPA